MKKCVFIFYLLLLFCSCKKEAPQGQYELFISFEKDGISHYHEGTELTLRPGFYNRFTELFENFFQIRSHSISILRDSNAYELGLSLEYTLYNNAGEPFESSLDSMFILGPKEIGRTVSGLFIPDTTYYYVEIDLDAITRTSLNNYHGYNLNCIDMHDNYFEIKKVEKIRDENDSIKNIILDADFDLLFCSENNEEQIHLKNGSLRYIFSFVKE